MHIIPSPAIDGAKGMTELRLLKECTLAEMSWSETGLTAKTLAAHIVDVSQREFFAWHHAIEILLLSD